MCTTGAMLGLLVSPLAVIQRNHRASPNIGKIESNQAQPVIIPKRSCKQSLPVI